MRYADRFDFESVDDGGTPSPPAQREPAEPGASAADEEPGASPPDDDAVVEAAPAPGDGAPEPPLWSTADDHVLHLPPRTVERVVVKVPWLGGRRPGVQPVPRRPRRRAIHAIGQMVRRAKRIGTRRTQAGALSVFRSRAGGRNFRILSRPRAGLRHEIVSIDEEFGGLEHETPAPGASACKQKRDALKTLPPDIRHAPGCLNCSSCGGSASRAQFDDGYRDELRFETTAPPTARASTTVPSRAPAISVPLIRFVTLTGFSPKVFTTPAAHDNVITRIAHLILASRLVGSPIADVQLVGHAADGANDAVSLDFGRRRAENVKQRLVNTLERLRYRSSSGVRIQTLTRGKSNPLIPNTARTTDVNRRVDVFLPRTCQTFMAQYDLQFLPRDPILGVPANPNLADKAGRERKVTAVVRELVARRDARAREAAAGRMVPANPLSAASNPTLHAMVVELSKVQLKLFRDYLPGPSGISVDKFTACFWKFAGGELRSPHPAFPDSGVGEPEGDFFFLFAEFAFLCAESGIDQAVWEPALKVFVGGQEIFMHVYHPTPAAPPSVGAPLPAPGAVLTSLDAYDFKNFKRTGAAAHLGVGQSNTARKVDLLRKYKLMGLAALRAAAAENMLRAQRMR